MLDLKKKLTVIKGNVNAPETKSPAKYKKGGFRSAEPMHVPEQNGDTLTDVATLESAIAKQVLKSKKFCYFFLII